MKGKSLFLFSIESYFRRLIYKIVNHSIFETLILLVIVVSTVQVAMDNPLNDPNGRLTKTLARIDFSTTIVFTVEMILKIIAYGFLFNGENSYLRNTANQLDFVVTSISVSLILLINNLAFIFCNREL